MAWNDMTTVEYYARVPSHGTALEVFSVRSAPVIAIVDDDLSVRRALHRLVRSAGYTAQTFASADEFLRSLPRGRPACLVLDIRLGGMRGFDLRARLAADGVGVPSSS